MRTKTEIFVFWCIIGLLITSLNVSSMQEIPEIDSITFHESVVKEAVFDWKVEKHRFEGGDIIDTMSYHTLHYQEGDTLSIKIVKDPSESSPEEVGFGIFEYQLNGTPFSFEDSLFMMSDTLRTFYYILLYPIQYSNNTGTHDFFELYYEYLLLRKESKESMSEDITITVEFGNKYLSYEQDILTEIEGMSLESHDKAIWNIETGFLEKSETYTEVNNDGNISSYESLIELQNGSISIPFNWIYSLYGLIFISISVLVFRKRKKILDK